MLTLNKPAPDFSAPATSAQLVTLSHLIGQKVVLYFYPKDCTAGCTQQGKDFTAYYKKFISLNTVIFGISRDTITLHNKFKSTEGFPFDLLSDSDQKVCELYAVLKEKVLYGKKTRGIERSTFLIDEKGLLRRAWRGVKVAGHVQEVLQAVAEL